MQADTILDTHLHLVDRSRLDYPWLKSALPLRRDWLLEEYAKEARRVGIGSALFMEVDVADPRIEDEITWVEELAAGGGFPIRGILASGRPESDDFPAYLDRLADRPLVKGIRRVLHVMPDELSQTATFRANIARMAGPDLPFDICVLARQLPLAVDLADAAPNVRFVLDHCGVPDIAGDAWDDWARDIRDLSRRPNVWCKVSGVVAYGGDGWTLDGLSRWITHIAECFGPRRLCWGGDWSVCTLGGSLSTWVAASRAVVADWSAGDRARLFSGTAEEIWRV